MFQPWSSGGLGARLVWVLRAPAAVLSAWVRARSSSGGSSGRRLSAWVLALLAALVLFLSSSAPAWAVTTGQLRVIVAEESGLPLGGATVTVTGPTLIGGVVERRTDPNGDALFTEVPPGIYRAAVSMGGYQGVTIEGLQVLVNRTTVQQVVLSTETFEAVTISSGRSMSQEFSQRIPSGRTYQSAVQTVPGVQAGSGGNPNMAGGGTNENTYMLDGASVTGAAPAPPAPQAMITSAPPPPDRMVHHDGWAAIQVADPRGTLQAVEDLAAEVGGRTERLAGNVVTVRVPVDRFEDAWEQVLTLGEIVDRSVRAEDVTDQHTATELRAELLRATLDRLIVLLGMARTEAEKLRLLKEITRVSEQLDAIEQQLRILDDLASMSRITVEALPQPVFAAARPPEAAGFEWIAALSPFRRSVDPDRKRVDLPVPAGLVALTEKGPFVAESAEGVVLWTGRLANQPLGSADFWVDAIEARLADSFADPVRRQLGRWDCLALSQPAEDEPYRYEICVQTRGDELVLAQSYYPSAALVERYGARIEGALGVSEGT